MRPSQTILLFATVAAGWIGVGPAQAQAPTNVPILYAGTTPTIDAVKGADEWAGTYGIYLGTVPQKVHDPSGWSGPNDYSAHINVRWDQEALYFIAEVTDDVVSFPDTPSTNLWQRDGIEFYIGLKNPQDPSRQTYETGWDFQVTASADKDPATGALSGHWHSGQNASAISGPTENVAVKATAIGYIIEGRIPWALLTSNPAPALGQVIGFNIQGDDNDQAGPADDTAFSLSEQLASWQNPSRWTQATLQGLNIYHANTRPIVDGVLDGEAWNPVPAITLNKAEQAVAGAARWSGVDDYSATVKVTWDEINLFVLADVTDDVVSFQGTQADLWKRDSLEISLGFTDPQDPTRTTFDSGDVRLILSAEEDTAGALSGHWYTEQNFDFQGATGNVQVTKTDTGYVLEARIPLAQLAGAPVTYNRTLGFHIQGNDQDNTGQDQDTVFALGRQADATTNPSRWLPATLRGAEVYYAVMPPTVDGDVTAAEWSGAPVIMLGAPYSVKLYPGSPYGGQPDFLGQMRVLWDAENVYMAAEVTDDVVSFQPTDDNAIWQRDSVELYLGLLDPQDPNRQSYDFNADFQIAFTALEQGDGTLIGQWFSAQAPQITGQTENVKVKKTANGWSLEAKVPWAMLESLEPIPSFGRIIGYNVMAADQDAVGNAQDDAFGLGDEQQAFLNPSRWAQGILLGAGPTTAPIVKPGDVDLNFVVDLEDVRAALRIAGGLTDGGSPAVSVPAGDLVADGEVNLSDAVAILRIWNNVAAWEFNSAGNTEGWTSLNSIPALTTSGGQLTGTSDGGDPHMHVTGLSIDASNGVRLEVRMQASVVGKLQFYWATPAAGYNEPASVQADITTTDMTTYVFNIAPTAERIISLRADPMSAAGTFAIDYIRITR